MLKCCKNRAGGAIHELPLHPAAKPLQCRNLTRPHAGILMQLSGIIRRSESYTKKIFSRREVRKMKGSVLVVLVSFVLVLATGTAYSGDAGKGKALFNAPGLGTNGKSCNTCHPAGKDIDGSKGSFNILGEQLNSREDAVNFCIENAMDGKPLASSSEDMKNIVSYIKTLKVKKKTENISPGY